MAELVLAALLADACDDRALDALDDVRAIVDSSTIRTML